MSRGKRDVCICCGQIRVMLHRDLCKTCYFKNKRNGTLENYPKKEHPKEWQERRRAIIMEVMKGRRRVEIAEEFGINLSRVSQIWLGRDRDLLKAPEWLTNDKTSEGEAPQEKEVLASSE